jgi:hypothetical protein
MGMGEDRRSNHRFGMRAPGLGEVSDMSVTIGSRTWSPSSVRPARVSRE